MRRAAEFPVASLRSMATGVFHQHQTGHTVPLDRELIDTANLITGKND